MQRLRGPRLQWIPVLLILVPLVGSAMALLSLQDPYGRMRDLPAAIVNLDSPTDVPGEQGTPAVRVEAGKRVSEEVKLSHSFAWRVMNRAAASNALRNGDVYLVLVIPEDFSARVAEGLTGRAMKATLEIQADDANGYLAGIAAREYAATLEGDSLDVVLRYEVQRTADVWADVRRRVDSALKAGAKLKAPEPQQTPPQTPPPAAGADQIPQELEGIKTALSQLNGSLTDAVGNSGTMASQLNEAASTAQSAQDSADSDNLALITQSTTQTGNSVRLAQAGVTGLNGKLQEAATSTKALLDKLSPLISGSKTLGTVATELDGQLQDLAKTVPVASAARSGQVQRPVSVRSVVHNPARILARGIAPLAFSVLAGGSTVIALTVLGRVNPRGIASPATAFTLVRAGWLPPAAVSALSTCGLLAFSEALLTLDAEHFWASLLLCGLAGLAAAAMGVMLKAAFGLLGEAVFLLFLVLQFCAAGGLHPVETSNALFAGLHPYLPMTYTVEGLRVAISGGPAYHFWTAVAVLGLVVLTSLGLATLCIARRRQWTGDRLTSPFRQRC
ncbi:YhgE/Pip domain-containing protein [Streptomyces cyaneofuscatus]|uniref:YhgE/Pip domain-containing protein n=1 Tax=Streptomyces cyaneofuscatus TaxID=66883 RepID=UPI0038169B72